MALVVDGGGLVNKGGALGTGAACCCAAPPCSGPCDGENPCPEGCACAGGECVPDCGCVDWCCAEPSVTIAGQQLPYKTNAEYEAGPKPCNCLYDVTCIGSTAQFYGELSLDGSYDNDKFVFLNIYFECSNGVSTVTVQLGDGVPGNALVPGVMYGIASAVVNFNCFGGAIALSNWQWLLCTSEACDGAPVEFNFLSAFPCNPLP